MTQAHSLLLAQPQPFREVVFLTNLFSTLALFGLIWFVQLVHYPLFLQVKPQFFAAYEAEHARRTGWIAAPLMILELISSLLLLDRHLDIRCVTPASAALGAALTAGTWFSTFLLQVPLHNRLHTGFDEAAIQRLVATNWIRTALWTLRSLLVLRWMFVLLSSASALALIVR